MRIQGQPIDRVQVQVSVCCWAAPAAHRVDYLLLLLGSMAPSTKECKWISQFGHPFVLSFDSLSESAKSSMLSQVERERDREREKSSNRLLSTRCQKAKQSPITELYSAGFARFTSSTNPLLNGAAETFGQGAKAKNNGLSPRAIIVHLIGYLPVGGRKLVSSLPRVYWRNLFVAPQAARCQHVSSTGVFLRVLCFVRAQACS